MEQQGIIQNFGEDQRGNRALVRECQRVRYQDTRLE
jgi:hypothetical protein